MEITKEVMGHVAHAVNYFAKGRMNCLLNVYEVDDLKQEVYLKLLKSKSLDRFDKSMACLKNYLFSITKNLMLELIRRRVNRDAFKTNSLNDQVFNNNDHYEKIESIENKRNPNIEMLTYIKSMVSQSNEVSTPFGTFSKSFVSFLMLSAIGYRKYELAKMFGYSNSQIKTIYNSNLI